MGRWAHVLDELEAEPRRGFVPFDMPDTYRGGFDRLMDFGPPPPKELLEQGACVGQDPKLFYGEETLLNAQAVKICRTCPVMAQCGEYAESVPSLYGVWGGKPHTLRFLERMKGPGSAARVAAHYERERQREEREAARLAREAERKAHEEARQARIAALAAERQRIAAERPPSTRARSVALMSFETESLGPGRNYQPMAELHMRRRWIGTDEVWTIRTRGIPRPVETQSRKGLLTALELMKEKLSDRPEYLPMVLAEMQRVKAKLDKDGLSQ